MSDFTTDYDIDLLTKIIEYNHNRFIAFQNDLPFEEIEEYEKILHARYTKVGRIKKRLIIS